MNYIPKRIMVPLAPDASVELRQRAKDGQIDEPRHLAADLVRRGLGLSPLCPQCYTPTIFHPDAALGAAGVWYCPDCQESVLFEAAPNNSRQADPSESA